MAIKVLGLPWVADDAVESYMERQPKADDIFNSSKSTAPTLSINESEICWFNGKEWQRYYMPKQSTFNVVMEECREFGKAVAASQWEFPDGYQFKSRDMLADK